jgi:hypothetical protein
LPDSADEVPKPGPSSAQLATTNQCQALPLSPSKSANRQPDPGYQPKAAAANSNICLSPLKMLASPADQPRPDGPSSNSIADLDALPNDAFISLDPLEENDPYLRFLDDRCTLGSLFGHEL